VAQTYLKRVEGGESMADAAKAMRLPHQEFGPFSRVNPPLNNPVVVGTAFGLDVGQRSGVLDTKDGLYLIQVLEHDKADSAAFVKDKDTYRAKLLDLARQDRVRGYLGALRETAKVVDNRGKLQQRAQQPQQVQQPTSQL
jgi:parvulin-like peptidyl-prolyl isomerase